MTITSKRLFTGRLTTSATTLYTAPAGSTVTITAASLSNTTANARTATLYLPAGGGAGVQNIAESALAVAASESGMAVPSLPGAVLEGGFSLVGQADADGALTLIVHAIVETEDE